MSSFHSKSRLWLIPVYLLLELGFPAPAFGEMSLSKLREAVGTEVRPFLTFRLEGKVTAFNRRAGLVALDDGATVDLIELPSLPDDLRAGDRVAIDCANGLVSRGPLAIRIGTAPLIEITGHHPAMLKSGKIFLTEGMCEIRVEWFNGFSSATLELSWASGADLKPENISVEKFWHREEGQEEYKPGLKFSSYLDAHFYNFPDFSRMTPESIGIAPDLDLSVRPRPEMVGLAFSGFIKIPRTGLYDFYLNSDDGARLFVADVPVTCRISSHAKDDSAEPPVQDGRGDRKNQWVTFEGVVGYSAKKENQLELEMTRSSGAVRVVVADGSGLDPQEMLHKRVKIVGLEKASGVVALDATQVEIVAGEMDADSGRVLTHADQIRQLQPDDPVKSYRAEIQGVVTMVLPRSLVIQDATGGVFVHYQSSQSDDPPQPGELWKISGQASQGDFSPVMHCENATYLGEAALPQAVQPTQAQLASGSLDAEMVEIEGVVISVTDFELNLLTRGGNVSLMGDTLYPLPTSPLSERERESLVGGVVRLRGVYRPLWDDATGTVLAARLMLGNSTLSVNLRASDDPFAGPLTSPSDLLLFTSHPTALKRVKVRGQLLYSKPPRLFCFDGERGFRVVTRQAPELVPGDEVEISGFPQLGGHSPSFLEAMARKTDHSPLPAPLEVPYWNLPDQKLDAMLVKIEATVLSNTIQFDERTLEMRAGSNRFLAIMPSGTAVPEGIERDSILRLTGVYISATPDKLLSSSDPFEVRLLDANDIMVVKRGPWWTYRRTVMVVGILSVGLVLAASWVALLRRTVAKRSKQLAIEIEEREAVERHRTMEQERSRMAKDLHDELGSGITEAGILSSLIRNPEIPNEAKNGYLEQLSDLCCSLVTGLDEIVWAVNPRYDSVADLAGYTSLYAQRFLTLAGIACRLDIDEAITADPLDSRTRHCIFLVFKEALNNIVKHSRATEVRVSLKVEAGFMKITLSDNGCGFIQSGGLPGSDGLRNMEERIQSIGGAWTMESNPDAGTIVQFQISLEAMEFQV